MSEDRAKPGRRVWILYLLAGTAAIVAYYALPRAGAAQAVVLTAINASAAAAAFRAARRIASHERVVCLAMGTAMALATIGNAQYYGYPLLTGHAQAFPCPADVFFLLTYPCYVVALRALSRRRRHDDRMGDNLDAAILTVAGAALMWQFVIAPVVHAGGAPFLAHAVSTAYPVMDLVVFAMLVRFAVGVSARNRPLRILLGSFVVLLVADMIYASELSVGTYAFGGLIDGMWMASYLLIGVAALHPGATVRWRPAPATGHRVSTARFAFLSGAVLTGPVLIARQPKDLLVAAAASAVSFVLVMIRVTGLNRQLAAAGVELERRASTDPLTGLANRAAFTHRLEAALATPDTTTGAQAVVFIDLDDFKDVNDTHGHAGGDELLREVSARLREVVRPGDLVARLGGDEFAVLLDGVPDAPAATRVAERAMASLTAPVDVGGTWLRVRASAGVAMRKADSDPVSLMREADVAMYSAKGQGKNRIERYDADVHDAVVAQQALKAEVAGAAARGELVLDYQPLVDLATGDLAGLEALVRWQHPRLGLLPPSAFIEMAESTGAIVDIGSWVLETAACQLRTWQRRYNVPGLSMSVNVSGPQLDQPRFADHVFDLLHRARLAPVNLVVEVTESVLVDPVGGAAACLGTLRGRGVRVAIDDFGTGYSSMSYLGQLPVDILKIDRSFVSADRTAPFGHVLLGAIVDLAKRLRLGLVAEGIEQPDQLARVRALGVSTGQGYLFSCPVPAPVVESWLAHPERWAGSKACNDSMVSLSEVVLSGR